MTNLASRTMRSVMGKFRIGVEEEHLERGRSTLLNDESDYEFDLVRFLIFNAMFCIGGVAENLLAYKLDILGVGRTTNGITTIGNPLSQVLGCLLLPYTWSSISWDLFWLVGWIAPLEILGFASSFLGVQLLGSGMFTVIYSFIVVFNACSNYFVFKKRMSIHGWGSVFLLAFSVAFSCYAQVHGADNWWQQVLGIIAALLSVLFFGIEYVFGNEIFKVAERTLKADPSVIALLVGLMEVGVIGTYMLIFDGVRWNEEISDPVKDSGTSTGRVVMYIIFFLLACGIHQFGFYFSLTFGKYAAVTSGVNKCLQAAVQFYLSHIFYCSDEKPEQCVDAYKIIGTIGVCVGILGYTYAISKEQSRFRDFYETIN